MKRFLFSIMVALCASPLVFAANGDKKAFEIKPAAPPTPALQYQLLFDNYAARRPGNAAIFYYRVMLLQNEDADKKVEAALDALAKGDTKGAEQADTYLDRQALLDELDLAARCSDCDWQDPLHEFGFKTLLPQLVHLRDLGRFLKLRGMREAMTGKLEEALVTARLGYEMSRKTALSPTMVSGLVGMNIATNMDDVLVAVMNSPQSPNFYWALRQFPSQRPVFQNVSAMERLSAAWAIPELAKVLENEEISKAQWNQALRTIQEVLDLSAATTKTPDAASTTRPSGPGDQLVENSSAQLLQQARVQYAKNHERSAEDAANVDPVQALGEFYFLSFVNDYDNIYKLSGLPYPQLLPRAKQFESEQWSRLKEQQPANIFLQTIPGIYRAALKFAYVDRQIAGLTAVQAISAYAAAHQNQLPAKLADVIDTPVPENPATGLPFEYKVDGDQAVLSDSTSAEKLEYTVKIRK